MKKIFSFVLIACMLCAMMVTVNAAGTCSVYFTTETPTVKVGDTFDVTLYVELAGGANFSGGNIYVDYDNTVATITAINTGDLTASASTPANPTTGFANWTLPSRPTTSGSYMVVTFEALAAADEFVVGATSTTFRTSGSPAITKDNIGKATIKIESDAPVGPTTVYGDAVKCADTWTTAKSADDANTHTFQNVAVAEAKFNAAANAKEAGFAFAKNAANGTYGTDMKVLDATAIAGDGTVEYAVVLYAVPYDADFTALYAKPYYVPAN